MAGKRITIELRGMHVDDGHVLLDEFSTELGAISKALRSIERIVTKKNKPMVSFRVINLSHSSPAKILLEAQPIDPEVDYSDKVVKKFYNVLDIISKMKKHQWILITILLKHLRGLGKKSTRLLTAS
ncbi:MAG: hypothetical protein GY797_12335 [Deltaproteobacteria bacterium]|nr:hypothetical protein [Deltaproteobacteria bacterium]